jgi:peptidyl-prolyl cis-trans isomerase A (cyclophilin A)
MRIAECGMKKLACVLLLAVAAAAFGQEAEKKAAPKKTAPRKAAAKRSPGAYATLQTSLGRIVCRLYEKEAPKTVANFIGLAEGTKEWTHPAIKARMKTPLYSGTVFHRVIPNFMIQGGDPLGNGTGNPGYRFEDEFVPGLTFNVPGRLAMANSGPNTNGSQFFITEVPTPHLNNVHTIFGQVVEGQELVGKIARSAAKVTLEKVTITRVK